MSLSGAAIAVVVLFGGLVVTAVVDVYLRWWARGEEEGEGPDDRDGPSAEP